MIWDVHQFLFKADSIEKRLQGLCLSGAQTAIGWFAGVEGVTVSVLKGYGWFKEFLLTFFFIVCSKERRANSSCNSPKSGVLSFRLLMGSKTPRAWKEPTARETTVKLSRRCDL